MWAQPRERDAGAQLVIFVEIIHPLPRPRLKPAMSYPPPSSASYGPRAVVTRGAPGYTTGYATGGYVSGPAHYQHRAFSASPGVQVLGGSSAPPPGSLVQPSDLPPGAS